MNAIGRDCSRKKPPLKEIDIFKKIALFSLITSALGSLLSALRKAEAISQDSNLTHSEVTPSLGQSIPLY